MTFRSQASLEYTLRSIILLVLLVVFAALMLVPAAVPPSEGVVEAASYADPVTAFESGELLNARQAAENVSGTQTAAETRSWQELSQATDGLGASETESERYEILATYYELKGAFLEDGTLTRGSNGHDNELAARFSARRYRRLAEFGAARDPNGKLWWDLPGECPALIYLAGAIPFQPAGYLSEGFYSLPLSLLTPQSLLFSNACLLWCVPATVIAWRVARLRTRQRLFAQAPGGPAAKLFASSSSVVVSLLGFVAVACAPAALVTGIRNGAGSLAHPVTLMRDWAIIETCVGSVIASQLAILALMALVVSALVELVAKASGSATLGAVTAALFCAVPLTPIFDLCARSGNAALQWLPQTYLNLRRVAGTPLETDDLSRELLYIDTSSGAVETIIRGVDLTRAALMLGGTAAALLALALAAHALRRPSVHLVRSARTESPQPATFHRPATRAATSASQSHGPAHAPATGGGTHAPRN